MPPEAPAAADNAEAPLAGAPVTSVTTTDPSLPPLAKEDAPPPAEKTWRDDLPPELRDDPTLKLFADPASLAKAHVEAKAMIGRKGLIVPKEGDPPEVVEAFRKGLGVPDSPDKYDLKPPEGLPEGLWDEKAAATYREAAHKANLSPMQAQRVAEIFLEQQAEQMRAVVQAQEDAVSELRREWGVKYDLNLAQASRAMQTLGLEPLLDVPIGGMRLGDHPLIVKAMAKVGAEISEDGAPGLGTGRSTSMLTPGEAAAAHAELLKEVQTMSRTDPGYASKLERLDQLAKMKVAGSPG